MKGNKIEKCIIEQDSNHKQTIDDERALSDERNLKKNEIDKNVNLINGLNGNDLDTKQISLTNSSDEIDLSIDNKDKQNDEKDKLINDESSRKSKESSKLRKSIFRRRFFCRRFKIKKFLKESKQNEDKHLLANDLNDVNENCADFSSTCSTYLDDSKANDNKFESDFKKSKKEDSPIKNKKKASKDELIGFLHKGKYCSTRGINTKDYNPLEMFEFYESDKSEIENENEDEQESSEENEENKNEEYRKINELFLKQMAQERLNRDGRQFSKNRSASNSIYVRLILYVTMGYFIYEFLKVFNNNDKK